METVFAENRRARFDYDILETFTAGIELEGHEVKSVKNGGANLTGSYAVIRGGEAWLLNATIAPYQQNNVPETYVADRTRRLLLRRDELRQLHGRLEEKSISLLPLSFIVAHGLLKIQLGLGRSRKKHDKREVLKKRDSMREMRRAV